jgi:hypothetical protein
MQGRGARANKDKELRTVGDISCCIAIKEEGRTTREMQDNRLM